METIQITYGLRIEGNQFKEISFSDTTPEFKNIILKQVDEDNCRYELLVQKNIYSRSENHLRAVFKEASTEADKFKYIFSVAADIKIFDFECLGYYRNDSFIKLSSVFPTGLVLSCSAVCLIVHGDPAIKKIKQKMLVNYNLASIQMFYDAATVVEPVARFLSLYALLLHKFGDNQKVVDDAILQTDPTVAQFSSPHFSDVYETVFSKLRNEMSHKRDGINILETQNEIRSNVDRFEAVVKALVLKRP